MKRVPSPPKVRVWKDAKVILLEGQIQNKSAKLVKRALKELSGRGPLWFVINTNGGFFYPVLKIRLLLKKYGGDVRTVAFKKARSGGLLLLQLGNRRFATRGSELQFHQAVLGFDGKAQFNAIQLITKSNELLRIDAIQLGFLSERTKKTKKLFKYFGEERCVKPVLAKKLGLIDEVLPSFKNARELVAFLRRHDSC